MEKLPLRHGGPTLDRRSALKLLLAVSSIAGISGPGTAALADTESDLQAAQARYAEAQKALAQIADDYEDLSRLQSDTLGQIEDITGQIGDLEKQIDQRTSDLEDKKTKLSATVSGEYKDGSHGLVDLVLGSKSIEELISNVRSYDKITQSTADLIEEVRAERDSLQAAQQQLEDQRAELGAQQVTQAEQLSQMREKQDEAEELVDGLDSEVKDLIAKRDAELLAAQEEAKKAAKERAEQEEAAKKAAESQEKESASSGSSAVDGAGSKSSSATNASSSSSDSTKANSDSSSGSASSSSPGSKTSSESVSGSAAAIVASCKSTPSPGAGLCAAWVSNVFTNAGYGFIGGNANDMYNSYATYSSRSQLKPGMIVAVSTHPHTSAGRIYGHIGIYIGGGQLMENVGSIRTSSIDWWCSYYGATVTPRWGWLGGIVLG